MMYTSTRDSALRVSSAQAIAQGISPDGGLFLPEEIPEITAKEQLTLAQRPYPARAEAVLSKFLTDFTPEELRYCAESAYVNHFDTETVTRLAPRYGRMCPLELWHGPTCAFKDMALQILPYLLTTSLRKIGEEREVIILVATSGDTGKAALEGFRDVPGTRIMVFYPENGVSAMQRRQMVTQEGENVQVCAVRGNFDDCQNGVKRLFTDPEVRDELSRAGKMFSSANSINWGRLVPQIVYYVSAYAELVARGDVTFGEKVNVCVPTGNFGNILAAYYAKKMGVPFGRLLCASNVNHVLTDFLETGTYDRNREFHTTYSPSMDILISSNLERLLWLLTEGDDAQIRAWQDSLARTGTYTVTNEVKEKLHAEFAAGYCDDAGTLRAIGDFHARYGYTADTHTAVALRVYEDYAARTGDTAVTLVASTASPFKFSPSVLRALGEDISGADEYTLAARLSEKSALPIPPSLAALKDKPERFTDVIDKEDLDRYVLSSLGVR